MISCAEGWEALLRRPPVLPLAHSPAEARDNKTVPENAIGLLYNSTLCIGCKACMSACKTTNELPLDDNLGGWPLGHAARAVRQDLHRHQDVPRRHQHQQGQVKDGFAHIKRQCLHCIDPSCVSVCPVQAMTKDPETGVVSYDADACIGCRYCVAACPFHVPQFQYDTPFPRIAKCQFCKEQLAKGDIPACAKVCPTGRHAVRQLQGFDRRDRAAQGHEARRSERVPAAHSRFG